MFCIEEWSQILSLCVVILTRGGLSTGLSTHAFRIIPVSYEYII